MNPPISGQNMRTPYPALRVQANLLVCRWERPRHLEAAVLAEHEPHLARRPQAFWPSRPERRARPGLGDRAQQVLVEKAIFAACFC